MLKAIAKQIIPLSLRIRIRKIQYRILGVDNKFKKKTNAEIFDEIYQESMWGQDEEGNYSSGTGGAPGVSGYISVVREIIKNNACDVVVDLGCGDFKIGQHIAPGVNRYVACDVSDVILAQNRRNFDMSNVEFCQLDLSQDALPQGDVCTVREVLQHLSNESIQQFINEINLKKPFKYLLVTEHNPKAGFTPNIDKPSGPHIRAYRNSGVVLHEPPFNLVYKTKSLVFEDEFEVAARSAVVVSTLYEL